MGEKQTISKSEGQQDNKEQLRELSEKRVESLRDELERAEQTHKEQLSESDALNEAKKLAHETNSEEPPASSPAERRRGVITKKQLSNAYKSQMNHAQEEMTPTARLFSKAIHLKAVEQTSDFVGSTIARPNAMLSGSITAFIAVTVIFFVAKHYGYQLSGFETIGAFILGWIAGILFDYFAAMFRGRSN